MTKSIANAMLFRQADPCHLDRGIVIVGPINRIHCFPTCPKAEFMFTAGLPTYDIVKIYMQITPSQFPNGLCNCFIKYGNGGCSGFSSDSLFISAHHNRHC